MLTAQTRGLLPAVLMLLSVFALGHTSQLLGSSSQNIFLIITAGGSMIKTSLETHLEQHPHSIKLRTSEEGNTPLHVAARHSSPEIVSLLLRRGADVNAKNRKGQTPLDITKVENIKTLMVSGARRSGTRKTGSCGKCSSLAVIAAFNIGAFTACVIPLQPTCWPLVSICEKLCN